MIDCSAIVQEIGMHLRYLLTSRALCPYMGKDMVGECSYSTASFYEGRGYGVTVSFARPLTAAKLKELNDAGHWINQGFVFRLYALLEYHKIVSKTISINDQLDGHNEIDILRRLRNLFGHTLGEYDPQDSEERMLYQRIAMHFSLDVANHPDTEGKFPIPIDQVLIPLAEGCKRYVEAKAREENDGQMATP